MLAQLEPLEPCTNSPAHAVRGDGGRRHSGWCADGVGQRDRTLKVWDVASGELLQTLEGHSDSVTAIAITPDGTRAVRDAATRRSRSGISAPPSRNRRFQGSCCSGHGGDNRARQHACDHRGNDYAVRIWDLERGELLKAIDAGPTLEDDVLAPGPVSTMLATADMTKVVSISRHVTVRVWRLEDGALVTTFSPDFHSRNAIAVTPDDRRVVLAREGGLTVWDLSTGDLVATRDGHAGVVTAIAAVPGGSQVVSAGEDGTLRLWDLDRAAELRVFEGHEGIVTSVAVTRDGAQLVSGGGDATLKVWNVADASVVFTLAGHQYRVTDVAVTPDGSRAVSASWDDMPRAWDIGRGSPLGTFAGHTGRVSALAVTGDGTCAVLATTDGTVAIWHLDSCRRLGAFDADAPIVGLAVGSDARTVVAGDDTGGVHFLRIERAADRRR